MSQARKAPGPIGTLYEHHRPEQTLLYQLNPSTNYEFTLVEVKVNLP